MTTSNTATFNPDISEIIEEAYEKAGLEVKSGYDVKTARRSLNLISIEWANRGVNLWTIEEGSVVLSSGTAEYNLPADTIDLLEQVIRTTSGGQNQDINISRMSVSDYAGIPNKQQSGKPVQIWIDRQNTPRFYVWPVPDSSTTYTLRYWRLRRIQDVGNTGQLTFDIPFRFIPCLIAGLAYQIASKRPEAEARIPRLKQDYEEQWTLAAQEDREKSSERFVPQTYSV
tara:strand:- start:10838 stop:11521 length:684 start_codon:yes stop_codon:yes gene_type:complete